MSVPCTHWSDCGKCGGGCCACPKSGVTSASYGHCLLLCPHYDGPDRGDGDALKRRLGIIGEAYKAVRAVAASAGIAAPCGCEEKQLAMNAANPAPWVAATPEQSK